MSTPSTWPDGATSSRERDRRGAAAAADIDDALAWLQLRPIDHKVGDRPEHNVLRRLPLRPALSGGTVPVGDLVGVLIVACGGVHLRYSFCGFGMFGIREQSAFVLRAEHVGATAAKAGLPSRSPQGEGW